MSLPSGSRLALRQAQGDLEQGRKVGVYEIQAPIGALRLAGTLARSGQAGPAFADRSLRSQLRRVRQQPAEDSMMIAESTRSVSNPRQLGAGGMGEVYRARDTKLNRDVAIKILPDVFAHDSERVARFTREAQTLASLNHPNIAQIYGVLEEDPAGARPRPRDGTGRGRRPVAASSRAAPSLSPTRCRSRSRSPRRSKPRTSRASSIAT